MMLEKNEAGKGDKEHWCGSRELLYRGWSEKDLSDSGPCEHELKMGKLGRGAGSLSSCRRTGAKMGVSLACLWNSERATWLELWGEWWK